jgi:hypothetical protein
MFRNSDPNYWHPTHKALLAALIFTVLGVGGFLYTASGSISLPLALFYAVLTINSYFSVIFFATFISPDDALQRVADVILVVSYGVLSFTFGDVEQFAFCALALFLFTMMKYTLLLTKSPHVHVLRRKITINIFGSLLCLVALGIAFTGHGAPAAWTLALVFSLANIYFLCIRPMYSYAPHYL